MLGKRKDETEATTTSAGSSQTTPPAMDAKPGGGKTVIGEQIVIEGSIQGKEDLIIEGNMKGTIELGPNFWIRVTTDSGTHARRYPPPRYIWCDPDYNVAHASMVPIHQNFLRAFTTGESPENTGEDNLKTMRLVEAAYESAERNQVITFD